MELVQPAEQSASSELRVVRFTSDANLTFVNYGTKPVGNFTYRREARLHNAQRRLTRSGGHSKHQSGSDKAVEKSDPARISAQESLLGPLSTFGRDPFHQTPLMPWRTIESVWCSTLPHYFGLPRLDRSPTEFPDPAKALFGAARASDSLYRAIVIQPVVTSEAKKGNGTDEAVFQNQALIMQDFNRLVETYNTPKARISSHQFEHIFASAFALSGHGFGREAGYNAIIFLNSIFMLAPHNKATVQTLASEWIRMLLPRPGPSFRRSQIFQTAMSQKVNSIVDFLEHVQNNLHIKFQAHISQYFCETSPIYRIISTVLPEQIPDEPYKGFHLICFHRILSMLLRYLEVFNEHAPNDDRILAQSERLAHLCLQYPPPERIALFTWCLLANAEAVGLNEDQKECCFSWTMKEMVSIHKTSFVNEMAAWLLHKANVIDGANVPLLDIAGLRKRMQDFYEMDIEAVNRLISCM